MKLAIFGATGKTGRVLVAQALARGYHVTALVRHPATVAERHPYLTMLQGDGMDPEAIERTIHGAEAVLSVIGHGKASPPNLQAVATGHMVTAMKKQGIERLVTLTGAGVRVPQDQPQWMDRLMGFLLNTFSKAAADDARAHYRVLRASGLAWTMVRGPRLTQKPGPTAYRTGLIGKESGLQASRANIADFMLKVIENGTHIHEAPVVWDV
jgi:putative NADH-flavin reductase